MTRLSTLGVRDIESRTASCDRYGELLNIPCQCGTVKKNIKTFVVLLVLNVVSISGIWWISRRKKENCRRTKEVIAREKGSEDVENCLGHLLCIDIV